MADEIQAKNDVIWGAREIGREVGLDRGAAYHLLNRGLLPARRVGRKWVASRDQLRRALEAIGRIRMSGARSERSRRCAAEGYPPGVLVAGGYNPGRARRRGGSRCSFQNQLNRLNYNSHGNDRSQIRVGP
jgi:hypothetical protein